MLPVDEEALIKGCLNGVRSSQEALYKRFASKMLIVCCRYTKDRDEAEDILQEGFIKVFEKLSQFKSEGSLEGWIRKIMVHKAIEHYRRSARMFSIIDIDKAEVKHQLSEENILNIISAKEMLQLVQELPNSYRMAFNLYTFEGMKHKEIAEQLGITEGTSKSNLSAAREILQRKITQQMLLGQKKNA